MWPETASRYWKERSGCLADSGDQREQASRVPRADWVGAPSTDGRAWRDGVMSWLEISPPPTPKEGGDQGLRPV